MAQKVSHFPTLPYQTLHYNVPPTPRAIPLHPSPIPHLAVADAYPHHVDHGYAVSMDASAHDAVPIVAMVVHGKDDDDGIVAKIYNYSTFRIEIFDVVRFYLVVLTDSCGSTSFYFVLRGENFI